MNDILKKLALIEQALPALGLLDQSQETLFTETKSKAKLNQLIELIRSEGEQHCSAHWAAHMTGPISSASALGLLLAGLHAGNLLSAPLYPALANIEKQLLGWFQDTFKLAFAHFSSGSTYGNLEALWQAKQRQSTSRVVYASEAVHYSINKACEILDLDLVLIATNTLDQIDSDELATACKHRPPLAIIATLGTSAIGAIDPISECHEIAKQHNAWLHIDAAWGGAMAILPEYAALFSACQYADSLCFDPHKGWQQAKPSSVLLYQQAPAALFEADTHYIETQPRHTISGSYGGELFLPLWCDLQTNGVAALQQRIRTRLEQASLFADYLEKIEGCEVYPNATGIVCFRINDLAKLSPLIDRAIFSKAKVGSKEIVRAVFASDKTQAQALIIELERYL